MRLPDPSLILRPMHQQMAGNVKARSCLSASYAERARPAAPLRAVWLRRRFVRQEEAILAYDLAALKRQGLQAVLNEPLSRRVQCFAVPVMLHVITMCACTS